VTTARSSAPAIVAAPPLPVQGSVDLEISVDRLWNAFADVRRWREWNTCMAWSAMVGGRLEVGATLVLVFNPIQHRFLYRLPAWATIVELEPSAIVTWEVKLPGFHALHSYRFEALGSDRCRFGSWETAGGPLYRLASGFWLAHFTYVCEASLRGASELAARSRPVR
jgi:hypothetical protein